MGQVLHGSATTTEAIRRAIQHSQESLRALAKRYGINPKTVAKWRGRTSVSDERTGPREAKSTVLTVEEEAIIVAFRRHTLLPLDDCLYALQATIPQLTRSSLHRCLQRHGIGRLPDVGGEKITKKRFKAYPIGFFHIDIAEVQTTEGKLYLLVAIDRTSKFAFVELHRKATRRIAADFLRHLVEAVPYRVHTILTDNGTHFTDPTGDGWTPADIKAMLAKGVLFRCHAFDAACANLDIEHRLTKPMHPWTNGQVERMNRTIKDATVRRYHYDDHAQLERHLGDFIAAYNFGRRLKTLKGLTPYEFICKQWISEPARFRLNPLQQMPGLNSETKYYLANLAPETKLLSLAAIVKARWICEQAHQQVKEELGFDHFEGRSWQGLHRHALMTMIAYAFLQHRRLAKAGREKKKPRPATSAKPSRRPSRNHHTHAEGNTGTMSALSPMARQSAP